MTTPRAVLTATVGRNWHEAAVCPSLHPELLLLHSVMKITKYRRVRVRLWLDEVSAFDKTLKCQSGWMASSFISEVRHHCLPVCFMDFAGLVLALIFLFLWLLVLTPCSPALLFSVNSDRDSQALLHFIAKNRIFLQDILSSALRLVELKSLCIATRAEPVTTQDIQTDAGVAF